MSAPYIPFKGIKDPVTGDPKEDAVVGEQIKVTGANFGSGPQAPPQKVEVGNFVSVKECVIISWDDQEIVAVIPPDCPKQFGVRVTNDSGLININPW